MGAGRGETKEKKGVKKVTLGGTTCEDQPNLSIITLGIERKAREEFEENPVISHRHKGKDPQEQKEWKPHVKRNLLSIRKKEAQRNRDTRGRGFSYRNGGRGTKRGRKEPRRGDFVCRGKKGGKKLKILRDRGLVKKVDRWAKGGWEAEKEPGGT